MNAQILIKMLGMMELTKIMLVMVLMTLMVEGDLEEELLVETTLGKVRGERRLSDTNKEVDVWSSIPFAEPPTGKLR